MIIIKIIYLQMDIIQIQNYFVIQQQDFYLIYFHMKLVLIL